MINKRSARTALLACASLAALGLLGGASPVSAKVVKKTKTVSRCVDTAVPIVDYNQPAGASTASTAAVGVSVPKFNGRPQNGKVKALNTASVRISHTFDQDLLLLLISPGGKAVVLSNANGGSGDGYGSGATGCTGSLVSFGDLFTTPIQTPGNTGNNPIVGSFKPEQPLATLIGGGARGNWTLAAVDQIGGDTGVINAVAVNLTYSYKVLKK
jgi:subtilisin-like proprotein convertase family protein